MERIGETASPGMMFRSEFSGYSVKFSPFEENLMAYGTAQHFGIVGNGRLYIIDIDDGRRVMRDVRFYDTQDGIYDVCWSEGVDCHVIVACGDGSLKLYDIKEPHSHPILDFREHQNEVYSVDWNLLDKNSFISSSWDRTVKLWTPTQAESIRTFAEHSLCVYSACWAPRFPDRFASCSGDGTVKMWELNNSSSVLTIPAHDHEVLTCDWNKYNENVLLSGSADKTIKMWDIRNPLQPFGVLRGHTYAVRRVRASPHNENILASVSYDMTLMIWDTLNEEPIRQKFDHHREFVLGVDFNLFLVGQIASCSWDETCHVWTL